MNSPVKTLKLSVVVICHEMALQIENTLFTLLPPYQRDIELAEYEIILVDNGSARPLAERLQKISPNVRYVYVGPGEASPNPAAALNHGVALARSPRLCLMIDGARMVTPGTISWGLRLMDLGRKPVVEVRGWHLGPKWQPESVTEGYDHDAEVELLKSVAWQENGYRLWEIAAPTPQCRYGFSGRTAESNCLFISVDLFAQVGGFDERSRTAGGGLVNLAFFSRLVEVADPVFTLLGEGTFHQVHGGAATGLARVQLESAIEAWRAESDRLGHVIAPDYDFIVAGHVPPPCAAWLARYAEQL